MVQENLNIGIRAGRSRIKLGYSFKFSGILDFRPEKFGCTNFRPELFLDISLFKPEKIRPENFQPNNFFGF